VVWKSVFILSTCCLLLLGLHGFIPGIASGLILLLLVSRFTRELSTEHLAWVWGENRPLSTKGRIYPSLR